VLYLIPGLPPSSQEVPLEARAAVQQADVFWFANGRLIAHAAADERVWWTPTPGMNELRVVDSNGRGSAVVVEVVEH